MKIRPNAPLLIGIGLPVAMVVFVAASIYLPGLFAKQPAHNFIYSIANDDSYCGRSCGGYEVQNAKLAERSVLKDLPPETFGLGAPSAKTQLFLHNVTANQSQKITFEEANTFRLDDNEQSPDGYTVTPGSYGGFPFGLTGDSGANKYYLTKGNFLSRELKLGQKNTQNYYSFIFLGWTL